ncbi:hypothetical protein O9992_17300 [Vibrio lentus]|nr:hypothetical protein [Vibrio lentus]
MSCPALPDSDNYEHCQNNKVFGVTCSTVYHRYGRQQAIAPINRDGFKQFFDMLEPAIGMQVSLVDNQYCGAVSKH